MTTLYEVVTRIVQTYKTILFSVFLIVLFSFAAYFMYTRYYSNYANNAKFSDVANMNNQSNGLQIFLFYADWCPHCQTAKPDWAQFTNKVNGQKLNKYNVETVAVDCTALDENPDNAAMVQKYKVKGYPTVFALKNGQRIDYDAKVQLSSLNQFADAITK